MVFVPDFPFSESLVNYRFCLSIPLTAELIPDSTLSQRLMLVGKRYSLFLKASMALVRKRHVFWDVQWFTIFSFIIIFICIYDIMSLRAE